MEGLSAYIMDGNSRVRVNALRYLRFVLVIYILNVYFVSAAMTIDDVKLFCICYSFQQKPKSLVQHVLKLTR